MHSADEILKMTTRAKKIVACVDTVLITVTKVAVRERVKYLADNDYIRFRFGSSEYGQDYTLFIEGIH